MEKKAAEIAGIDIKREKEWAPLSNINDAWKLIQKIGTSKGMFNLIGPIVESDTWCCYIGTSEAEARTPEMAITECYIKAMEGRTMFEEEIDEWTKKEKNFIKHWDI